MQNLKSYRKTPVNYAQSQAQINNLLADHGIMDIQYSTISHDTAAAGGISMEKGTLAIMLVFQKLVTIPNGSRGQIPVRVIVPNVDPAKINQHYRLLFWYMKSKFEAIDSGLVEFAEEFMAHLQIQDRTGIVRLWDRFKAGFYKAVGNGDMPGANLLPPITRDPDEEDN